MILKFSEFSLRLTDLWRAIVLHLVTRSCNPGLLVMIDLDHFKKVNDTLGHLAGHLVLNRTAERMKWSLNLEDFEGRLGRDEVLAIFPHTDSGAMMAASRLVLELHKDPRTHGKDSNSQTIGIGVTFPRR